MEDFKKLRWLNTKDEIISNIGDAILGLQESGAYSDAYIRSYIDVYIGRKCDVAFMEFNESEDKFARIDMFNEIHGLFGVE
jgi:hypothetical protein